MSAWLDLYDDKKQGNDTITSSSLSLKRSHTAVLSKKQLKEAKKQEELRKKLRAEVLKSASSLSASSSSSSQQQQVLLQPAPARAPAPLKSSPKQNQQQQKPAAASSSSSSSSQLKRGRSSDDIRQQVLNDLKRKHTAQQEAATVTNKHDGDDDDDDDGAAWHIPVNEFATNRSLLKPDLTYQVSAKLASILRPYQREGVLWMMQRFARGHGALLADDMGLGKTIQSIALVSAILHAYDNADDESEEDNEEEDRPQTTTTTPTPPPPRPKRRAALIIVPTSVKRNWLEEFQNWTPSLRVMVIDTGAEVDDVLARCSRSVDAVIVGYEMYTRNYRKFVDIPWLLVVFDEIHRLKNRKTQSYQACLSLYENNNTRMRIGLTGTLIQNHLVDWYNVCSQAIWWRDVREADQTVLFDDVAFRKYFEDPILLGQAKTAKKSDVQHGNERHEELMALQSHVLLRRDKRGVLKNLPKKVDRVVFCEMTPFQINAYERALSSPDFMRVKCKSCREYPWCKVHRDLPPGPFYTSLKYHYDSVEQQWILCEYCPMCFLFPCLIALQKIANHLDMIRVCSSDPPEKQVTDRLFCETALGDELEAVGGYRRDDRVANVVKSNLCGKMSVLEQLLDKWLGPQAVREKNKVLIFSNSVRMLYILGQFLAVSGYTHLQLDGTTPSERRQYMCKTFNTTDTHSVFLISTKAGGVGLNLTGANKVVIFDPNWNAAWDLQAQDRAYRMGQKRDVEVFRLIAAGSIEENQYLRQVYKRQMALRMERKPDQGNNMARLFTGVGGSKAGKNLRESGALVKGELFGMDNVFVCRPYDRFADQVVTAGGRSGRRQRYKIDDDEGVDDDVLQNDAIQNIHVFDEVVEQRQGGGGDDDDDDDEKEELDPVDLALKLAAERAMNAIHDEDDDEEEEEEEDDDSWSPSKKNKKRKQQTKKKKKKLLPPFGISMDMDFSF